MGIRQIGKQGSYINVHSVHARMNVYILPFVKDFIDCSRMIENRSKLTLVSPRAFTSSSVDMHVDCLCSVSRSIAVKKPFAVF